MLTYEELKEAFSYCSGCHAQINEEIFEYIDNLKAENQRLTEENKRLSIYKSDGWSYVLVLEFIKNLKNEAIKEVGEQLKKELLLISINPREVCEVIDNVLKEMETK